MSTVGSTSNSNSNNNTGGGPGSAEEGFVEVWAKNLDEQFDRMRQLVQKYPYVAMVRYVVLATVR